jgi:hypothetical protein
MTMSDEAPENLIWRMLDDTLGRQNDIEAEAEEMRRSLRDAEQRLSNADKEAHRLRLALYVLGGAEADDAAAEKENRERRREIRQGKR